MKLFIDIGNQQLKWARCDQLHYLSRRLVQQQLQSQICSSRLEALSETLHDVFSAHPRYDEIWVSHVASQQAKKIVKDFFLEELSDKIYFVEPQKKFGRLTNGYDKTARLGIDRWLASVAVTQLFDSLPMLIVDAGTALTIDYVDRQCVYRGGIIVPGLNTMMNALVDNTRITKSAIIDHKLSSVRFANTSTEKALLNGAKTALVATLDRAIAFYEDKFSGSVSVVLTGGDALLLSRLSQYDNLMIESYLVLQGLAFMAEEKSI